MEKQLIISEEIVKAVVRPVSLFLNDIEVGTTLTHVTHDKVTKYNFDKDKKSPTFYYNSDKGGSVFFKTYDFRRFYHKGVCLTEYLTKLPDMVAEIAHTIKITKCTPSYVRDKDGKVTTVKAYPQFAYEGYDELLKKREAHAEANKVLVSEGKDEKQFPREHILTLYETNIKDGLENRYYRDIELDIKFAWYATKK